MTQTTRSPRKLLFEPAPEGDGYLKMLKDVAEMPASLLCDPIGKWHNPKGEHFTIEIYPDDPWWTREINAGRLVPVKQSRKQSKPTPDAAPSTEESK